MKTTPFRKTSLFIGLFCLSLMIIFTSCHNTNHRKKNTVSTQEEGNISSVEFTDENGTVVSLDSLKGKVVFINFWATWCPPCRRELPSIETLKESFEEKDQIVFLMVDVEGKMKKALKYMKNNDLNLPVYIPKSKIPTDFLGTAIPTTVILNKKGEMVARTIGAGDYSDPEIEKSLKKLIAQE